MLKCSAGQYGQRACFSGIWGATNVAGAGQDWNQEAGEKEWARGQ